MCDAGTARAARSYFGCDCAIERVLDSEVLGCAYLPQFNVGRPRLTLSG